MLLLVTRRPLTRDLCKASESPGNCTTRVATLYTMGMVPLFRRHPQAARRFEHTDGCLLPRGEARSRSRLEDLEILKHDEHVIAAMQLQGEVAFPASRIVFHLGSLNAVDPHRDIAPVG